MEKLIDIQRQPDYAAQTICQPRLVSVGDLPEQLRKDLAALGPSPMRTLAAFVDLGLSDAQIARYFDLSAASVTKLCAIWQLR